MPSLKTWPISSPGLIDHRRAAAGTGVAGLGVPQVEHAVEREVAAGHHALEVDVHRVAADDDRRHRRDRPVDDQRDLDLHRAEEAHRRAGRLLDRRRVGRHQRRRAERPADLGLVRLVVAPQQRGHRLAVGQVNQQLGRGRLLDLEELADLADRPLAGRRRPLRYGGRVGSAGGRAGRRAADLGPLLVGRVAAGGALDDLVLAGRAGDHELVRASPPIGPLSASTIT